MTLFFFLVREMCLIQREYIFRSLNCSLKKIYMYMKSLDKFHLLKLMNFRGRKVNCMSPEKKDG